jgi:hypothetical protein
MEPFCALAIEGHAVAQINNPEQGRLWLDFLSLRADIFFLKIGRFSL